MNVCLTEQVVQELQKHQYTISTAESCTGGMLASTIIDIAGSSSVFNEGYITYSNEAKKRILAVSHDTLVNHGAVSEETAIEMALAVQQLAKSDVAISTTGIAGPSGGTAEKPVGLIYICIVLLDTVYVRKLQLYGDRTSNRRETVGTVLRWLLDLLSASSSNDKG